MRHKLGFTLEQRRVYRLGLRQHVGWSPSILGVIHAGDELSGASQLDYMQKAWMECILVTCMLVNACSCTRSVHSVFNQLYLDFQPQFN